MLRRIALEKRYSAALQYRRCRHNFKAKTTADADVHRLNICSRFEGHRCVIHASGAAGAILPTSLCAVRSYALRQLPSSSQAAVSAALLKSQSGDGLDAGSFVSVGAWHRVRKLNARLHKRHGAAAASVASLQAADAPASSSSSEFASSDSETDAVPALLPFKAGAARAGNGMPVVSARAHQVVVYLF